MNNGETVSFLRNQKNLTIRDICGKKISRQTYTNFVNNKSDTSLSNFTYLLNNLCVTFDEFFFIQNGYNESSHSCTLVKLKDSFEKGNYKQIEKQIKSFESLKTDHVDKKDVHMYWLARIFLGKLIKQDDTEASLNLLNYLTKIETWSRYEIVLFNNSMFTFNNDYIEMVLDKVNINLQKYNLLRKNEVESFRVYINVCLKFLEEKNIQKFKKYLSILNEFSLTEEQLYERTLLLFLNGLHENQIGYKNGKKKIDEAISILKVLNCPHLTIMFEKLYSSRRNLKL